MFCRQCGYEVHNTSTIKCPNCNTKLGKGKRVCERCGERNSQGDDICHQCGFSFATPFIPSVEEPSTLIDIKNGKSSDISEQASSLNQKNIEEDVEEDVEQQAKIINTESNQELQDRDIYKPVYQKVNNNVSNFQTNPNFKESDEDEASTISLAKKLVKNDEPKNKIMMGYGKKVTNNPLAIKKTNNNTAKNDNFGQTIEENNDNKKIEKIEVKKDKIKTQTPEKTKQASINNSIKNIKNNSTPMSDNSGSQNNKLKETQQIDNTLHEEKDINNNSNIKISTFLLLTVVLSTATLGTCQLIYAIFSVIFSFIDLAITKKPIAIIIAVASIVIAFIAVYFGISFYNI